jgi:hypothetical protein
VQVEPYLYDLDDAAATCDKMNVAITEDQLQQDPPNTRECTLWSFLSTLAKVKLERRLSETDRISTGTQGFLGTAIVYSMMQDRQGGDYAAKGRGGRLRVVALSFDWEVWSRPSQPIQFAMPGDFGQSHRCALLQLDALSAGAVSPVASQMLYRTPAVAGGYKPRVQVEHLGVRLPMTTFGSWIMPPDWKMSFPIDCEEGSSGCITQTPTSHYAQVTDLTADCRPGLEGLDCRSAAWLNYSLATYGEYVFPAMRVQALDEEGKPVAGIRVRLHVIMGAFPGLPAGIASIISCGLCGEADGEGCSDVEFMDGTDTRDLALPCITGADGFAEMRVRFRNRASISEPPFGMGEFVKKAVSLHISNPHA